MAAGNSVAAKSSFHAAYESLPVGLKTDSVVASEQGIAEEVASAVNSDYNFSARSSNKVYGWWQGNGISERRAKTILGKALKGCSSCLACTRERCRKCGLCRLSSQSARGACVFWCCQNNNALTKGLYIREMEKMLKRKNKCLHVGSRVYNTVGLSALNQHTCLVLLLGLAYICLSALLSPQQCWGEIQSMFQSNPRQWTVSFDNGQVRTLSEQV